MCLGFWNVVVIQSERTSDLPRDGRVKKSGSLIPDVSFGPYIMGIADIFPPIPSNQSGITVLSINKIIISFNM